MKKSLVVMTILALVTVLAAGCAELAPVTPTPTQPSGPALSTGTIRVLVTDAPSYEVDNVVVHFSKVEVHKAADEPEGKGEWIELPLATPDGQTFDETYQITLSSTMGNVTLAAGQITAGNYTQIRVYMDEEKGVEVTYTEGDSGPVTVEGKLPSGKLRFVRPFEVAENGETEVLLDFDLQKSVVFTGASQSDEVKVIVKPVVKLLVSEKGKPNELDYSLETSDDDNATAEQSDGQARSGEESVYLETTGTGEPGDEARIVIPLPEGTTLGDIDSISWWVYLVEGYIPHVDLELDLDADSNSENDKLVAEAAHQNDNNTTTWDTSYRGGDVGWIQTFEGASGVYTSWANWLTGSPSPVTSVNDTTAMWMFAADDATYRLNTLADFKDGIGDVDADTVVLAIEVEIDNWVLQTEAYVDDIEIVIGGVTYTVDL